MTILPPRAARRPDRGRARRHRRAWLALAAAAVTAGALLPQLAPRAAEATVPEPTTTPVVGNSTYFDGLGSPYGGCGLPQSVLETQDFIALNVYDTPRDYTFYPRPLPPEQASRIGIWNNGRNCGRWVEVTVSDFCTGVNDGAANQAFCRNGSWVADAFNGARLTMLVADSCGDSNAWCRDDPYHIDLARASLDRFTRDGAPVGSLLPNNFNNRRMSWRFIPAPNYSGDIQVGFLQGAQRWWPAISVSRLPNGIHGVEYFADGAWRSAAMNSDMGQSYIIGGTTSGGTTFRIRVRDVADQLVAGGREYTFTLPEACANQCSAAYTRVDYTTSGGGPTPPAPPPPPPPVTPPAPAAAGARPAASAASADRALLRRHVHRAAGVVRRVPGRAGRAQHRHGGADRLAGELDRAGGPVDLPGVERHPGLRRQPGRGHERGLERRARRRCRHRRRNAGQRPGHRPGGHLHRHLTPPTPPSPPSAIVRSESDKSPHPCPTIARSRKDVRG